MDKKEFAIVLGSTGNMTFAVANVLSGLKKHSPALFSDIIIFHNDITEKDKNLLNKILPCKFVDYEFPLKDTSKFNEAYFNQFTKLAYSRYECFNLLNEYKNVLWLDIDVLIQKDISGIFDRCTSGIAFAKKGYAFPIINNLITPIDGYDMNEGSYNSGVIVFKDNLSEYNKLTEWCYEKTLEFAQHLFLPDQAILNLMLQEFNLKADEFGLDYNFAILASTIKETKKDSKNAKILHSACPEKFWNFWNFKEWNQNYEEWIKMGGSPYIGKRTSLLNFWIKLLMPDAPNFLRKPRQFVIYVFNKILKKTFFFGV
ncbi:MAG: glycosyltransferase [Candidatus Gastranaerophilaceae bacterium]|jgi:lipopolysaccharide biosynthesis glycosyltransferase